MFDALRNMHLGTAMDQAEVTEQVMRESLRSSLAACVHNLLLHLHIDELYAAKFKSLRMRCVK